MSKTISEPRAGRTERGEGCGTGRRMLERHRSVWARKRSLRRIYRAYFERILDLCGRARPIVEIGAGPGLFKAFWPEIIATDITAAAWNDAVVDARALPCANGSVGSLVMIDVFHHMGDPARFLQEASRVLRVGGRVVMLEPWTSPIGYLFYRYIHHEGADRRVNPLRPFGDKKDAFDGNAAIVRLFFERCKRDAALKCCDGQLRVRAVNPMPEASWLLTGGFRPYGLLPAPLIPLARIVDAALKPISRLCALRAFIVLERTPCPAIHPTTATMRSAPEGNAARLRCPPVPAPA